MRALARLEAHRAAGLADLAHPLIAARRRPGADLEAARGVAAVPGSEVLVVAVLVALAFRRWAAPNQRHHAQCADA